MYSYSSFLTALSAVQTVPLTCRTVHKLWVGIDVEGSGLGLTEVLSRNSLGRMADIRAKIRTEYLPNTSVNRYRYVTLLGILYNRLSINRGTGQRIWLRHYATSRKVMGSIPNEIGFFNWLNPSSHTMVLGSTQPLTEMSTRSLPKG
jgi:hypothetical protein